MTPVVATLILGFSLTALLSWAARPLGERLGVMDAPTGDAGHKRHREVTPAVGGLIAAVVSSAIYFISAFWAQTSVTDPRQDRLIVFTVVIANMAVGFFDDRKHIPAITRLGLSAFFSLILLLLIPELQLRDVSFPSVGVAVSTGIFALPFTIVCLLALKNAVNMADGRNGLMLGMAIIWNVFFLYHAHPQMALAMTGTLASLTVLFMFNWRGKLFMGDCGSYGVASYFGILALYLHNNVFGTVTSAEVILLFLVPVLDTSRLIFVRLLNGHCPMAADGRHFHHLLENAIGWTRGWFVYMALVAVPLATYQVSEGFGMQIILGAIAAYALVVWLCIRKIDDPVSTEATPA